MERGTDDSGGGFRGSRSAANVNTARRQSAEAERERELLLQLLVQIADFVARKQQVAARHGASDWRRRSKKSDGADLFGVVVRVCEERMQRLNDEVRRRSTCVWIQYMGSAHTWLGD